MIKAEGSLSLNVPWAIGEDKYSRIVEALSNTNVERIVELGSGVSTIRLGQDFPEASIVSIEQDEVFCAQTVRLLEKYQVKNVTLFHCPIKPTRIGLRWYLTYALNIEQFERGIDLLLIDGPVQSQTLRGREAPIYLFFPLLKSKALVALDDYHRESAKLIVRNWLNTYGKSLQIYNQSVDLVLLQKCGEPGKLNFPGIRSWTDNMFVNLTLVRRALLGRFKQLIGRVRG